MSIKFEFFEAGHGDSILVSTDNTHILIDGGVYGTYEDEIEDRIEDIDTLDLVVLTHIDNDHICGLIEMFTEDEDSIEKVNEIWFNSFDSVEVDNNDNNEIAYGQGRLFNELIKREKINHRKDIHLKDNNIYTISNDIELILLSPQEKSINTFKEKWEKEKKFRLCNGKEVIPNEISGKSCIDKRDISTVEKERRREIEKDKNRQYNKKKYKNKTSLENRTSISFILKYKNKKFLFLGDADIKVINQSLTDLNYSSDKRLKVDFVKLSHHGSIHNINERFLDFVETDTFVVLTDCSHFGHPDKETFSMILHHEKREPHVNFIFNHLELVTKKFPIKSKEDEEKKHHFKAYYKSEISR